jgi:hypothetical protein
LVDSAERKHQDKIEVGFIAGFAAASGADLPNLASNLQWQERPVTLQRRNGDTYILGGENSSFEFIAR